MRRDEARRDVDVPEPANGVRGGLPFDVSANFREDGGHAVPRSGHGGTKLRIACEPCDQALHIAPDGGRGSLDRDLDGIARLARKVALERDQALLREEAVGHRLDPVVTDLQRKDGHGSSQQHGDRDEEVRHRV